MPWLETNPMEQRAMFVALALSGEVALAAACRRFGVSRTTGYEWLERYEGAGELAALGDRSRRPRRGTSDSIAATGSALLSGPGTNRAAPRSTARASSHRLASRSWKGGRRPAGHQSAWRPRATAVAANAVGIEETTEMTSRQAAARGRIIRSLSGPGPCGASPPPDPADVYGEIRSPDRKVPPRRPQRFGSQPYIWGRGSGGAAGRGPD